LQDFSYCKQKISRKVVPGDFLKRDLLTLQILQLQQAPQRLALPLADSCEVSQRYELPFAYHLQALSPT
jgi:hypothetical protein